MPDVADHPDDRHPWAIRPGAHATSNRILSGPIALRERAIDQNDGNSVARVAAVEVTTRENRNPHCLEIAWRDRLVSGRRFMPRDGCLPPFNGVRGRKVIAADGKC